MTITIRHRITAIARTHPDRTALISFDTHLAEQTLSWRQLADQVRGDEWLARPGTVGRGFLTKAGLAAHCGRRLAPPHQNGATPP